MSILHNALEQTKINSEKQGYDLPLINFLRVAIRWSNYLGITITPIDVAIMMVDFKIAREMNQRKEDNFTDMLGYLICVSMMDEQLKELGYEGITKYKETNLLGMMALLEQLENK